MLISIKREYVLHAIAFVLFLLFFLRSIVPLLVKRRISRRTLVAQRWLRAFRKGTSKYSSFQRFAFIRKVDFFLWEEILMLCFEERGYPVQRTKLTRDGGSDGFVNINGLRVIIQAKRYSGRISKDHVLALENIVRNAEHLDYGLFIHTGKSSRPIIHYARSSPYIELISGVAKILALLDGEELMVKGQPLRAANTLTYDEVRR